MSEDGCKPIFKTIQRENKAKSRDAGRPIFEDREYVEIIIPGSKNERPIRPVRDEDKERWPDEYRRFKEGQEQASEGTPLEQWPRMTRSRVYELKAVGVYSVEDLAALADSNLTNIGPDARELRNAAQAFLQPDETDALKKRIEELEAENMKLRANQKKTPGRKPKEAA